MNMGLENKEHLIRFLKIVDRKILREYFKYAYSIKEKYVGRKVYYRGIIEFSNICQKDCYYCGIRKSNNKIRRFSMDKNTILRSAKWAYKNRYGSLVLQSGEREDDDYVEFVEEIIKEIKKLSNNELGITLSVGEQEKNVYQRWYDAGAHRYLLRIETSNEALYKKIHPSDHSFRRRLNCLRTLKEIGYQVGTGVMIGLPYQKEEDLAEDILFYEKEDMDMIGMGPYIISANTPLAKVTGDSKALREERFLLSLKMIAATRIRLKDVNIASTTALQSLNPIGRELGLKAGANIIMPVITKTEYREDYQLYDNKPCIDDNADGCKLCLINRIKFVGDKIGFGEWGDSPHYKKNI